MKTVTEFMAKVSELVGQPAYIQYMLRDNNYAELTDTVITGYKCSSEYHENWRLPLTGDHLAHYVVRTRNGNTIIAIFAIGQFPGCCAFAVATGAKVLNPWHNRGVNTVLNQLRQHLAREAGYTAIVGTDVAGNFGDRTLAKNGYTRLHTVTNKRTRNPVNFWVKDLYTNVNDQNDENED